MILRRLYLYLVSAASLGVLAAGVALFGGTVLLFVFNDPSAQYSRGQLAGYSAMALVALPVWGIHFFFARRFAMRDPAERASAIRRAYLYAACLAGSVVTIVATLTAAGGLLHPVLDGASFDRLATAQAGWVDAVAVAVWWSHFRVAAIDRDAVGETGASATLRRWYMYAAALVGLLMMLSGVSLLLNLLWIRFVTGSIQPWQSLSDPAGQGFAGALVWAITARSVARHHLEDDRHSTLRALQGFIAVAVSIAIALIGGSQILYYALARALGVSNPGGVATTNLAADLAGPGSMLAVYGIAWLLIRRRLDRDAGTQESGRQAGIRRLYTNLAALVSLAAWAVGAGGLLWNLAEQIEAPAIGVGAAGWRDPVSLWTTLVVVGAAVWLAHWRPQPPDPERQSLSRRLYVWAALLASVLAVLGGGVGMLTALLRQVFSASPTLADPANLDFGHYLAVMLVSAGVGAYHWRALRADGAARRREHAEAAQPAPPSAPAGTETVKPVVLSAAEVQVLLDLVDWRRRVGDLYRLSGSNVLEVFRERRDELFRTHPSSAIDESERASFKGLRYFPPDPSFRVDARFEPGDGSELVIDTGGEDGAVRYRRAGILTFRLAGEPCRLTVLSLVQYAGGLFLPFRDGTSGHETYGGGRYLFDTAKDTDGLALEVRAGSPEVTVDFNYAYNASCAYNPRWACPLAPPENHLKVPIRAGEMSYKPA